MDHPNLHLLQPTSALQVSCLHRRCPSSSPPQRWCPAYRRPINRHIDHLNNFTLTRSETAFQLKVVRTEENSGNKRDLQICNMINMYDICLYIHIYIVCISYTSLLHIDIHIARDHQKGYDSPCQTPRKIPPPFLVFQDSSNLAWSSPLMP